MARKIIVLLILAFLIISNTIVLAEYPWSTPSSEKYPWLDYLASLTSERNVELVILTRHEASIQSLTRTMFLQSEVAKKLGITNIRFLYVAAESWPDYLEKAKQRGTSIDVAWGGGPTLFNYIDDLGYLMPINPARNPEHYAIMYELSKIPEQIAGSETYKKDSEGNIRWIGASISSFGFTVNHDVLNRYGVPKPVKWEDLSSPEYARYLPGTPLIATADPTMSTSNARIFEIILQAKGWEEGWRILTLLAANAIIYSGSGDARDAAIRGDVAIATTIDFYGYMAMNVNPNCEYIAPEGETIVNADPIAILTTTKHPVHAAAFVAWVLSEFGGQQIWLDKEINRIPINPYTFNTPEGQKRPDLKQAFNKILETRGILFNETLSALWIDAVINYFKATLVDVHDDLQYTWAEIAKAYLDGKITREQFEYLTRELAKPLTFTDPLTGNRVSFTLEYAVTIGKYMSNKSIADPLKNSWINGARERYQYVRQLLQQMLTATTSTPQETTTQTTEAPSGFSPLLIGLVVLVVIVIGVLFVFTWRK